MFKRLWHSLSSVGVKLQYDDKLIKRITLTNQFSFIAFLVCLFSGLNNYTLGDSFSAFIIEFYALLCLSGFWLNRIGYHRFATSFLLVALSTAIFYFDSYSGVTSGTFLCHFPLILAVSFVHDFKEKNLMIFHLLLPVLYLAINVSTHYSLFASPYLTDAD